MVLMVGTPAIDVFVRNECYLLRSLRKQSRFLMRRRPYGASKFIASKNSILACVLSVGQLADIEGGITLYVEVNVKPGFD